MNKKITIILIALMSFASESYGAASAAAQEAMAAEAAEEIIADESALAILEIEMFLDDLIARNYTFCEFETKIPEFSLMLLNDHKYFKIGENILDFDDFIELECALTELFCSDNFCFKDGKKITQDNLKEYLVAEALQFFALNEKEKERLIGEIDFVIKETRKLTKKQKDALKITRRAFMIKQRMNLYFFNHREDRLRPFMRYEKNKILLAALKNIKKEKHQEALMFKIALFLLYQLDSIKDLEEKETLEKIIYGTFLGGGICCGLVTLWLFSQFTTDQQTKRALQKEQGMRPFIDLYSKEFAERNVQETIKDTDNSFWFDRMTKAFFEWDGKTALESALKKEMDRFIELIFLFQGKFLKMEPFKESIKLGPQFVDVPITLQISSGHVPQELAAVCDAKEATDTEIIERLRAYVRPGYMTYFAATHEHEGSKTGEHVVGIYQSEIGTQQDAASVSNHLIQVYDPNFITGKAVPGDENGDGRNFEYIVQILHEMFHGKDLTGKPINKKFKNVNIQSFTFFESQ